ncbi:Zn-dependent hydrolase/oxidoreductase family protein, putative [Talaromyces stipitatus ATCC 10500]|uniref:Zn-dependent hydrolase/oxidoreductase family protein, putative n=1 Tax=Talaromyces stipitatus (strain ATCC 10500 / CBS 375.48 / QM 6759 / NRRL 1006) TaxID=441959 RepID=B8MMB1_TALSN|nr:Zn-dependent hydrolase/oxidoreductase family protein, putative [Talaromyces stipitatus ATCC 10500]EED13665.1 Zn-dependent hydrolase/oxidoreductase family protein, putative [Talaromyces stipitatus ATCC 10500]
MHPFIRRLFATWRRKNHTPRSFSFNQRKMSSSTSAILYALTVSASPTASIPDDAASKPHHGKGRFHNPWDSWVELAPLDIGGAMLKRAITGDLKWPDTTPPTVTVHKPNFLPSRETSKLRATWLGHACFYVEFPGGLRVLFDPVFEDRCSPFSWMGPKRYTKPPCDVSEIPVIDMVVISHNHYDHLSLPTVKAISKKHPNCHFFVPLGNASWFKEAGIDKVTELDWWDQRDLTLSPTKDDSEKVTEPDAPASKSAEIVGRISCLPCQHTSARGPFDRAKTLWASWGVESGGKKVYFGGDTGYRSVTELKDVQDDHAEEYSNLPVCPAFKQVGELHGPFDLGLIPIGAYDPRWLMSPMHADPHDAVNIFQDTKCKNALGIHWGTWVLTEEDVLEPPRKLEEALKRNGLPEKGVFDVCDIGESREF